jgi:carbon-monoxide dehydrogenase large subunit
VHVRTALGDTGQGHRTVFGIIAAEQLDLPLERVVVDMGDSTGLEDGNASSASRSTTMGGLAIRGAILQLLDAARERAAERLQARGEALVYRRGRFEVDNVGISIGLDDLAREDSTPLAVDVRINAESTFPNGCHVAEIEIDPETGKLTIVRYTAVDDCGRVIEHELAEGQVYGSLGQGIGQALMEHGVYDADSGQLASGSLMDYALPRAADLPSFNSQLRSTPARSNPLGVKGLGEGGTVGALPALANAIRDALSPLGNVEVGMPATPHRIWRAIRAAQLENGRLHDAPGVGAGG